MHGSISFKRSFIPWGFTAHLELLIPSPKRGLGDLYTELVNELVPAGALKGEIITDRKGRDPTVILDEATPSHLTPRREEILFVAGRTPTPEEEVEEITPASLSEPFDVSITTAFESFVGDHHIAHRTAIERHGALSEALDVRRIGRMWPLVIDRIRFGLELFRSRRTNFFGYTPTVERTVLIDADKEVIRVVFEHERLTTRDSAQLLADDTFRALAHILGRGAGVNLEAFIRTAGDASGSYSPAR